MINWSQMEETLRIAKNSHGGNDAETSLSEIIGEENFRKGIELYIDNAHGGELARCALNFLRPWSAMNICYNIYKTDSSITKRRSAVELLGAICDNRVIPWVQEFLSDPDERIQGRGAAIIESLFQDSDIPKPEIEGMLILMRKHSNPDVVKKATFIDSFDNVSQRKAAPHR